MYIQLGNNTNELLSMQTNKTGIKNRDTTIYQQYVNEARVQLLVSPGACPGVSKISMILAKNIVLSAPTIALNLLRFALQFVSISRVMSLLSLHVVLCTGNAGAAQLSFDMSRF